MVEQAKRKEPRLPFRTFHGQSQLPHRRDHQSNFGSDGREGTSTKRTPAVLGMPLEIPANLQLPRLSNQRRRFSLPHRQPSDLLPPLIIIFIVVVASIPCDQGVLDTSSDLAVAGACGVLQRMAFQAACRGVRRGVGNGRVRVRQMAGDSLQLLGPTATELDQCLHRVVPHSVRRSHRIDARMFLDQIPSTQARHAVRREAECSGRGLSDGVGANPNV